MSSSPPSTPRSSLPPLIPVRPSASASADDTVLFFGLEGAPREACRTQHGPGVLTFATELEGEVIECRADAIVLRTLDREVLLRHLLPAAVDLGALVGRDVRLVLEQRYGRGARACIRLELRDARGRLILLGWDGRMPRRDDVLGLSVRGAIEGEGLPVVHVQHGGGLARLERGGDCLLTVESRTVRAFMLRGGADELSLLLVRT